MKKIILTKGVSASGKSTWAKQQVSLNPDTTIRVNKDDFREMLSNSTWGKHREKLVLQCRDAAVKNALNLGFGVVIVDDTNLHPKHEERMKEIAAEVGNTVVKVEEFHVEFDEAVKRDLKRVKSVGQDVIKKQWKDLYGKSKGLPQAPPVEPYDSKKKDCIICDLDGTLSLFKFPDGTQTRNPFVADDLLDTDSLNTILYRLLSLVSEETDVDIILVSGRSSKYRDETEEWLENYDVKHQHLFMRKEDDYRKDDVVKREIWENYIREYYNVLVVFDDRNQMIELWRNELGFTTFQVANGDF